MIVSLVSFYICTCLISTMNDNMDKKLREKIKIRQEAHKNMEHVRKFSTEQLQAKIEEPDMKLFLIYPVGKSKVQHQNKKHYQQEGIWQNFMNRSVRNSSIGYSRTCTKSTRKHVPKTLLTGYWSLNV